MNENDREGSVTGWIRDVKQGDPNGIKYLWDRYFERLAKFVKPRLSDSAIRSSDEEDVASRVLEVVVRNAASGRFPDLFDRQDLWILLMAIAQQKISNTNRDSRAMKRGSGKVLSLDELLDKRKDLLGQLVDVEPTPDTIVAFHEICGELMKTLRDPISRDVAKLKLEGYTNREIAEKLDVAARTVDRKIRLIQMAWVAVLDGPTEKID